jgi:UDP-glucose 4-epimerase
MRLFISGGAGFIGSHLVARLLNDPQVESIRVFDNFSSGKKHYLPVHPRLSLVQGDLKNLEHLTKAMHNYSIVFHLAANPDISKAVTQPSIDFWDGTYLSQNILEAMRLNHIKTIFYNSGSGVYGEDPGTYFTENHGPCTPISTYGASKLASEALISSYCHMFSFVGRVFRFSNVVGPRQTHGVGYDFIHRLHHDASQLHILGDGQQCKSYIHVDDVIDALFLVLRHEGLKQNFEVFNVATDDYITVTEIADMSCEVLGLNKDQVNYVYTGGDRGWKGDVPRVLFDASKIKSHGWQARYSSTAALKASLVAMRKELSP